MEKSRRSIEENKGISITAVVLLVIMLVIWLFLIIFFLFSKSENNKKIESLTHEIESLKLDELTLAEKEEELNILLDNVSSPSSFLGLQKENYITELPKIEEKIKNFSSEEKVAYLTFIVDKEDNLDKVIESLNNNKVLATFFVNNKECADKINNSGNLIGLYIDNKDKLENINEEYKDIIEAYDTDLYMVSTDLKEIENSSSSLYKVVENSTSEGKKLLNLEGYISDIVDTTADRDFLIIKINVSNGIGVNAIDGIVSKLKDKNYVFLPLVSSSSLINK